MTSTVSIRRCWDITSTPRVHRRRREYYVADTIGTRLSTAIDHILDGLDELEIDTGDIETIALTHIHLDHAGAAGFLAEQCPNARGLCHERGIKFFFDEERLTTLLESVHRAVGDLADRYGTATPIPEERFTSLSGGETVSLGDEVIRMDVEGTLRYVLNRDD